jgi:phosphatidylglycerophosphate synthase
MYIDDTIANTLVANTPIFAHIHPNYFSCMSITLNVCLFYILYTCKGSSAHALALAAILSARYLTDILDGAIARAYSKVTVFGGLLDTAGDAMLILILIWYVCVLLQLPRSCVWISAAAIGAYMYYEGTVHDHAAYKIYGRSSVRDIIAWGINNTIFLFAAAYLFIAITLPRCQSAITHFEGCSLRA